MSHAWHCLQNVSCMALSALTKKKPGSKVAKPVILVALQIFGLDKLTMKQFAAFSQPKCKQHNEIVEHVFTIISNFLEIRRALDFVII